MSLVADLLQELPTEILEHEHTRYILSCGVTPVELVYMWAMLPHEQIVNYAVCRKNGHSHRELVEAYRSDVHPGFMRYALEQSATLTISDVTEAYAVTDHKSSYIWCLEEGVLHTEFMSGIELGIKPVVYARSVAPYPIEHAQLLGLDQDFHDLESYLVLRRFYGLDHEKAILELNEGFLANDEQVERLAS